MNVNVQVFIRSFGCSSNTADSEVLAGCLNQAGFKIADSEAGAEIVIYNTCAVKGPTENRIINALKQISSQKKVIIAGCLPLVSFERLVAEVRYEGIVGPAAADKIVEAVNRVISGEKFVDLEDASTSKPPLLLPRIRVNPKISVIPINYGCLGSCAYCCVVRARGNLRSYGISEILERVQEDVSNGTKEIWLTSQDTAAYGRDIGTDLAELVKAVTSAKGYFKVRVGMMTPNIARPILGDLLQAFKNEKVFKFAHLPVQSGDDGVLRRMRRGYTTEDFEDLVQKFRNVFPKITLSTDVICGFPGETSEAFENTIQLINRVRPDVVNVSKFFARPKTLASEMLGDAVEKSEIKRRSTLMTKFASQVGFERNNLWLGWKGEIFVDEKGKIPGSWIGRNFAYKPVSITSNSSMFGKRVRVNISNVFPTYLAGKIDSFIDKN